MSGNKTKKNKIIETNYAHSHDHLTQTVHGKRQEVAHKGGCAVQSVKNVLHQRKSCTRGQRHAQDGIRIADVCSVPERTAKIVQRVSIICLLHVQACTSIKYTVLTQTY